ncbi:MAG: hypothetical protein ACUVQG_04070 [Thermogutta sp.]
MNGFPVLIFCVYGLTFFLELNRARSWKIPARLITAILAVGLLAHSGWLIYRVLMFTEQANLGGYVLSVRQDWYYGIAWGLALICLFWITVRPATPFGAFFLPLILLLMLLGMIFGDPLPFARGAASRTWGIVHGLSILAAILAVCVALLSGMMYLGQVSRLRNRAAMSSPFRLPSLEWLSHAIRNALLVAVAMLGVGILSGIRLNALQRGTAQKHLPWHDPVVISTFILFFWIGGSLLIGYIYRPMREGRRVAYLTIVSFIFMLLVLGMTLFGATQHGQSREGPINSQEVKGTQLHQQNYKLHAARKRLFCEMRGPACTPVCDDKALAAAHLPRPNCIACLPQREWESISSCCVSGINFNPLRRADQFQGTRLVMIDLKLCNISALWSAVACHRFHKVTACCRP